MSDEPEESASVISVPIILVFVAVLCLFALLREERDLAVASILILGLTGFARIWSRAGFRGVTCAAVPDRLRLFPGEFLTLRAVVENRKILPILLRIDIRRGSDETFETVGLVLRDGSSMRRETGLLWHQKGEFVWEFTAMRRGVYGIGPIRLSAGDLFGFYRREREKAGISVIVYPRIIAVPTIALPRRDFFGRAGDKSPVHDPVYILGTRDYQQGLPARYIHWKASARYGSLKEKIFDPSEEVKVLIAIEAGGFSRLDDQESFEKAIEAAASIAVHLDSEGFAAGFVTNASLEGGGNPVIPPGRSPLQLSMMLETMARMRMESATGLADALERGPALSWGITCVLFAREAREILSEGRRLARRRIPLIGFAASGGTSSGVGDDRIVIRSLDDFWQGKEVADGR